MTDHLFEQIVDTSQDCVFWKDRERRFIGANRSFLDFYGFTSIDDIKGKTDEDMGWHSDPEPYKQDELRVLAGESTYKVLGRCMKGDEERDIIASKRPLYDEDGNIIGLVGSFSDVTDVLRYQNNAAATQQLYSWDSLRIYPYFDKILDHIPLSDILDPLTGVVNRRYILDLVHRLIADKKPFCFSILDLDNFKNINDTYGHRVGDEVLMDMTEALVRYVGKDGLIGRFGGDELLMLYFGASDLPGRKEFLKTLYDSREVVRRTLILEDCRPFLTATTGCAAYPEDATTFDELFGLIDKTLYVGKNKGRNCYVVYEKELHKDLELKQIVKKNLPYNILKIHSLFDTDDPWPKRINSILPVLEMQYRIASVYIVSGNKMVMAGDWDNEMATDIRLPEGVQASGMAELPALKENCPLFFDTIASKNQHTAIVSRIPPESNEDSYLVFTDRRERRIWQESETVILLLLSDLIAGCTGKSSPLDTELTNADNIEGCEYLKSNKS